MCLIPKKDFGKRKGAFWDKDNKTWFVPDYKDINLFSQWIDTDKVSIIAKAPFWIGVTQKILLEVWQYD